MDLDSNISSFPEYEKLKQQVEHLRAELITLLLERDRLVLVECKKIESLYMLEVGQLEYEAYKLQSDVLRAQRKLEIIEDLKERKKEINQKSIDRQLNREFDMYQEQLDAQMETIEDALEWQERPPVSEEKHKQLNDVYLMILKTLHPDLNPGISESELAFFNNARAAYERADLDRLQVISRMVQEEDATDNNLDSMAVLVRDESRLVALVEDLKIEIEKIKTEYPYSMKNFVRDNEALAQKKEELRTTMTQFEDARIRYQAIIRDRLEKIEEA